MCFSIDDSAAVKILALKFLVIMEIMTKHGRGDLFGDVLCHILC